MSKGKKKAFTLIGLCVLMVAAICLYLFIPKGEDGEGDGDASSEMVNVVRIDTDKITSVHVTKEDGDEISLTKDGDSWKLTELPDAPVDSDAVEGLFTSLNPVTASKEIEAGESGLSEYGLDKPQMTVQIATSDGAEYELKFGGTVPVTGGNYGLSAGSDKIYTFREALFNAFYIERNTLISKEEVASIDSDYLTDISVKSGSKYTFKAKVVPDDQRVDAYTNWIISEPYEKPLAGSCTDDWNTLQGFFTSVSFEELEEYGCSDMGKYGLDQPSSVIGVKYFEVKDGYEIPDETDGEDSSLVGKNTNKAPVVPKKYRDNKGYELYIGSKNSEGDYYVRLKDSNNVYTMSAEDVENMTGVDAYTYMDHSVYSTLATDINGYEITLGASGKKITVTHSTEKGDEDKDLNVWTLNGKRVSDENEEAFLTPYSKAYLLEFTSEAKDSVKPADNKPVLTAVYHEEGRDVTVTYYPYDGTNFYRVDKDGMNYFLVDKLAVDSVIESFESLLDLDQ